MWTKKFVAFAAPSTVAAIISAAWIWDALAQGNAPVTTNPTAPSYNASGPCATILGGSNYGQISPDCRTQNFTPPPTDTGLYQDGDKFAVISSLTVSEDKKHVTIGAIKFYGPFDKGRSIELQGGHISCPVLKDLDVNSAVIFVYSSPVVCDIVSK